MRRAGLVALTALLVVAGLFAFAAFLSARDDAGLSDTGGPGEVAQDQTSRTLRQGNVILTFSDPSDRAALRELAAEIGGPPDPALVHAGQSVLVQRDPDATGIEALAFRRRLRATGADDPQLRTFVEHFLGRGDGGTGG